jgi:hypothetical protein
VERVRRHGGCCDGLYSPPARRPSLRRPTKCFLPEHGGITLIAAKEWCAKMTAQRYLCLFIHRSIEMSRSFYRSMKHNSDRLPQLGESAQELGVRPNRDIPVDPRGYVAPMVGGMSITADDPMKLPPHRRPASYSGTGGDPVFEIHGDSFGSTLSLRQDGSPGHFLVETRFFCLFSDYQAAIHATRPFWLLLESHP